MAKARAATFPFGRLQGIYSSRTVYALSGFFSPHLCSTTLEKFLVAGIAVASHPSKPLTLILSISVADFAV